MEALLHRRPVAWSGPRLPSGVPRSAGVEVAEVTGDLANRRLALIVGETLVHNGVGWSTPWFVPNDHFGVLLHGQRFQTSDDLATDAAINEIERRVGRDFTEEFWQQSAKLSFGEVVRRMLEHGAAA
jgi:hypothetical protein